MDEALEKLSQWVPESPPTGVDEVSTSSQQHSVEVHEIKGPDKCNNLQPQLEQCRCIHGLLGV